MHPRAFWSRFGWNTSRAAAKRDSLSPFALTAFFVDLRTDHGVVLGEPGEVAEAVLERLAPYRTAAGGYRLENVFRVLVARRHG